MNPNFEYLKANKEKLIADKKAVVKHTDAVAVVSILDAIETKQDKEIPSDAEEIEIKIVVNTTGIMDSHDDVHIEGIWNRTIKEKNDVPLLQEHQMSFDKIISDDVKVKTEPFSFTQLGAMKYLGTTEALVFDAKIKRKRNEFMFKQYANGYVKNHSVGMRYRDIVLAINSNEKAYSEEKAAWDKYYPNIANKEKADEKGFFFAVLDADLIEGSAVPIGSNRITPTLAVRQTKASKSTIIKMLN